MIWAASYVIVVIDIPVFMLFANRNINRKNTFIFLFDIRCPGSDHP